MQSDLGQTAVDRKIDAGDVAGLVRCQEVGTRGQFLRQAEAVPRMIGVSVAPGLNVLTRIPLLFNSWAQTRTRARTPFPLKDEILGSLYNGVIDSVCKCLVEAIDHTGSAFYQTCSLQASKRKKLAANSRS